MPISGTLSFLAIPQVDGRYKAAFRYEGCLLPGECEQVTHEEVMPDTYLTQSAAEEAADIAGREWLEKTHPINP